MISSFDIDFLSIHDGKINASVVVSLPDFAESHYLLVVGHSIFLLNLISAAPRRLSGFDFPHKASTDD